MIWAPELELLDLLQGDDLSPHDVANLFPDLDRCRRSVRAMFEDGEISLLDPEGRSVPMWRFRQLQWDTGFWADGTRYSLTITEVGAERIG